MAETKYIKYVNSPNIYINRMYRKFGAEEEIDPRRFLPLLFQDLDVSFVNALRRAFISEIRNLAFAPDDNATKHPIDIIINTSQYHKEILIDRFGFITLNTQYIEYSQMNPVDLKFILCNPENSDQSLKNTSSKIMKITIRKHLKIYYLSKEVDEDVHRMICPFDSLLMTLNPNEEILAVMYPSYGTGTQHPIWHTCVTMYKFATSKDMDLLYENRLQDVVSIDDIGSHKPDKSGLRYIAEKTVDQYTANWIYESKKDADWDAYQPKKGDVVYISDHKKYVVFDGNLWAPDSDDVESNVEQMAYLGNQKKTPQAIMMVIESIDKFESVEVLRRGIDALRSKLEEIYKDFSKIDENPKISMEYDEKIPNFAKFKILGEDHTLGLILECACLAKLKELIALCLPGESKDDKKVELQILLECFSGYRKTHPLDNFIELIIRTPTSCKLDIPRDYVADNTPLGLVINATHDMISLCEELLHEVSLLFGQN